MSRETEFYVGYQDKAPAHLAKRMRTVVVGLILAAVITALAVLVLEKPFEPGTFEFGVVKEFEGVVVASPVPTLFVPNLESDTEAGPFDLYLLVSPGKHSATPLIEPFAGRHVRLQGSLIYRNGSKMIEVRPGSVESAEDITAAGTPQSASTHITRVTLTGEIVDSKCFLGVMKPGREKTHRSCAARCISGGIPPLLATTTAGGDVVWYILLDADGVSVNEQVLDYVAEPVAISGEIRRRGEQRFFLADLATLRRTSE